MSNLGSYDTCMHSEMGMTGSRRRILGLVAIAPPEGIRDRQTTGGEGACRDDEGRRAPGLGIRYAPPKYEMCSAARFKLFR